MIEPDKLQKEKVNEITSEEVKKTMDNFVDKSKQDDASKEDLAITKAWNSVQEDVSSCK